MTHQPSHTYDVSPSSVLRALDRGLAGTPCVDEEERTLRESVRWASDVQEAFLVKVATGADLLRSWCRELESWDWSGTFEDRSEQSGNANVQPHSRDTAVTVLGSLHPADAASSSAIPASPPDQWVEQSQQRIATIKQELRDVNIEQQKAAVLETHHRFGGSSRSGNGSKVPVLDEHTQLNDVDALTTALVLNSLPYYGRLLSLLDIWSSRLLVLSLKKDYLLDLAGMRGDLADAWNHLNLKNMDLGASNVGRTNALATEDFEAMHRVLEERLGSLGEHLDGMLDALEGRSDTLPSHWIDDVDEVEVEIFNWVTSAQEQAKASVLAREVSERPAVVDFEAAADDQAVGSEHSRSTVATMEALVAEGMALLAHDRSAAGGHSGTNSSTEPRLENETSSSHLEAVLNETLPSLPTTRPESFAPPPEVLAPPMQSSPRDVSISPPQSSDGKTSVSSSSQSPRASQAFLHPLLPVHPMSAAGRRDRTLHRRKSSHEVTIRDASLASTYSMSQVKKIDIVKGVSMPMQTHRRQRSGSMPSLPIVHQDIFTAVASNETHDLNKLMVATLTRTDPEGQSNAPSSTDADPTYSTQLHGLQQEVTTAGPFKQFESGADVETSIQQHRDRSDSRSTISPSFNANARNDPVEPQLSLNTNVGSDATHPSPSPEQSSPVTPVQLSRSQTPSSSTDEQLDRRIDMIIHSLPTRINFNRKARGPASRLSSGSQFPRGLTTPPTKADSNTASPILTLAPAERSSMKQHRAKSADTTIRLYYLMQTDKSPIRLFVRLIGDSERVMVRVGGGWADLAQYLQEYAAHHSRAIVPDAHVTAQDVKRESPANERAFSLPLELAQQKSSVSSVVRRGSPRVGPVPRHGDRLQVAKNPHAIGREGDLRSSSTQSPASDSLTKEVDLGAGGDDTVPIGRATSEVEGDDEDGGFRSKLTVEKKKWLEDMVARAKRWKAEGGSGGSYDVETKTNESSLLRGSGNVKRVYRTSDGTLREFGS